MVQCYVLNGYAFPSGSLLMVHPLTLMVMAIGHTSTFVKAFYIALSRDNTRFRGL